MYKTNQDVINGAYELYVSMHEKIKKLYAESENFLIPAKPTEDDLCYNTEEYIQQIFKNIAFAQGDMKAEETAFIKKMEIISNRTNVEPNQHEIIESVTNVIPEYLKLAKEVDKNTKTTRYAKELLEITEEICMKLQSIDGTVGSLEAKVTNAVIDNLKEYVK